MKTLLFTAVLALTFFPIESLGQTDYVMTQQEMKELEQRIKEKLDDFFSYLPEIAAKSDKGTEERTLAQRFIAKALELFIGEGEKYQYQDAWGTWRTHDEVKMQTTSRGRANRPKPMKNYLKALMALPYQKVEIDTCEAIRISNHIKPMGDGRYVCTAVVLQAFRAWNDRQMVVNDKDLKQVTIYIKPVEVPEGNGNTKPYWDYKLGDIRVIENWGSTR